MTPDELVATYDVFLLDSYGVLVDESGVLPGAAPFLARVAAAGKRALVVTNDASRLEESWSQRLAGFGLEVPPERIVTAGALLEPWWAEQGLGPARCLVLGTAESCAYVERAGGRPVPLGWGEGADAEVIAVCDDSGYPFLEGVEMALTMALRRLDRGAPVRLVLPNPDLVFPKGAGRWGVTAGSVALVLEAALRRRHPERADLEFARLGKPYRRIFAEAQRRAGPGRAVMIGDQLETDIAGAATAGIDSVLVLSGIARSAPPPGAPVTPTAVLSALS